MKKIVYLLVIGFSFFIFSKSLKADVTFDYNSYDVEININKDSSFTVIETMDYNFYGDMHGLRADIKTKDTSCLNQQDYTCGGFDRIELLNVYDENSKVLTESDYTKSIYKDEDTENEYFRIERLLYPSGKIVNGERHKWTIEYKIYGGLKWYGSAPIFYWNVIPEDMGGRVKSATVRINFPDSVVYNSKNFLIYDSYGKNPELSVSGNDVLMSMSNIGSYGALTVSYTFGTTEIAKPASINYKINSPQIGTEVYINNVLFGSDSSSLIENIPAGTASITFQHSGYTSKTIDLTLVEGQVKNIEVSLEPESWMSILLLLNTIICIFGLCFIPIGGLFVILYYRRNGRDKNIPSTIIPLFTPPDGVPTYMVGTLKDEKVDKEEVAGTIIDLAYRGYIKIKKITNGKEYELNRLEGKTDDKGLNTFETYLLDSIFRGSEIVTTSSLKTYLPLKFVEISNRIYRETVEKGYFKESPETTRNKYAALGFVLFFIGLVGFCGSLFLFSGFIGYFVVCTPLVGLIIAGFGFMVAAKYMPSKTEVGSKVYADILGFRMYLNTAERFTLQNLKPEYFERYLSYAIVFGIEKKWAEKFKDIYHDTPDWYEDNNMNVFDAMYVSSLARSFTNTTVSSLTPIQTSGSRGSGWGGSSGGFGGFSGGGGGGGGRGGF